MPIAANTSTRPMSRPRLLTPEGESGSCSGPPEQALAERSYPTSEAAERAADIVPRGVWVSRYHGDTSYFCSLECKEQFEQEPEDYFPAPRRRLLLPPAIPAMR
jgi:YHS domain-containing protein